MILNYIHWNPDPEIVNIFGISIRYYGLLFASGLILCVYILGWIYKREKIPSEHLEKLSIFGVIGILAGARLYEAVSYFLIFAVMIYLYKTQREKLKNGFFFGLVLVLIFTARFIIEFVKENQVGFEDGMTFNM
jgi:prolipoprotein diacylglyceryltransferase